VSEPGAALAFEVFAEGLDHPEGVAWGPDGYVYAGGEAGQIYRISLTGEVEQFASTGGFILGVCLDGDANVYACDSGRGAIMRISPEGEVEAYFEGNDGRRLVGPNYAVFDREGNLYFSESGGFHEDNGRIWVVRPGGRGEVLRDDLSAFPNGLALSPDEHYLYVVLSTLPGIARVPLGGGAAETIALLERKVPDGIAFDAAGALYISCYTPDEIFRLGPGGGDPVLVAEDWERTVLAAPTNVAFCGAGLGTLVAANLGRWHLSKAEAPVAGAPCNYPKVPAGRRPNS